MKIINHPLLAILFAIGFIALSYCSQKTHYEAIYDHSIFNVLDKQSHPKPTVSPLLLKQVAVYRSLYAITDSNMNSNIFGKE